MRGEEFLDAMEYVDPELIDAADRIPEKKKRRVPLYILSTAAAACFCFLIGLGIWNLRLSGEASLSSAAADYDTAMVGEIYEESAAEADAAEEMEYPEEEETANFAASAAKQDAADTAEDAAAEVTMADAGAVEENTVLLPAEGEAAARFLEAFAAGETVAAEESRTAMEEPVLTLVLENPDGTTEEYYFYDNFVVSSAEDPEHFVRIDETIYAEIASGL